MDALKRIVKDYLIFCEPGSSIEEKARKIRSRIYTSGGTVTANIASEYSRQELLNKIIEILRHG